MGWRGHNCGSLAPLQSQWGGGYIEVGWPRERQGIGFMRLLWAQIVLWGAGKGCLPSLRLKGGLEGRGRNPQPSVPWPRAERWCLPPPLLPPFSHIKARLFALDVSEAGPRYLLFADPFPEGPDYPGMHQPMRGGVREAPGQAGAPGGHPPPRGAPASSAPWPRETPLRQPLRDGGGCQEAAVPRPAAGCELPGVMARSPGCCGGTPMPWVHSSHQPCCPQQSQPWWGETRRDTQLPHRTARNRRDHLKIRGEGEREERGLNWPFFPLTIHMLTDFYQAFWLQGRVFLYSSFQSLLPNSGCGCSSSCNPSPKASTPLVWEQFGRSVWELLQKSGRKTLVFSKASPLPALGAFCEGFCRLSQKQFAKMCEATAKPRHAALMASLLWGPMSRTVCRDSKPRRLPGAGCRLPSSWDGICRLVNGNHELRMLLRCWEAGRGGPGVKNPWWELVLNQDCPLLPAKPNTSVTLVASPGKGLCSTGHGKTKAEQQCPLPGLKTRGLHSCRQN